MLKSHGKNSKFKQTTKAPSEACYKISLFYAHKVSHTGGLGSPSLRASNIHLFAHIIFRGENLPLDPNSCIFQINNEGAIDFYKNFGFDVVDTKENYYKRIDPADAYVLEKKLDGSSTGAALTNGNST